MTEILTHEDELLVQVETLNHLTNEDIQKLLLQQESTKYIGYRILFILESVKVGDWSYEEGIEELRMIGNMIAQQH